MVFLVECSVRLQDSSSRPRFRRRGKISGIISRSQAFGRLVRELIALLFLALPQMLCRALILNQELGTGQTQELRIHFPAFLIPNC